MGDPGTARVAPVKPGRARVLRHAAPLALTVAMAAALISTPAVAVDTHAAQARSTAPPSVLAVVRTIFTPAFSNARGLAVDQGDDSVYVAMSGTNSVSVISGRAGAIVGSIPVGAVPFGIAVDSSDDTVYVSNNQDGTLSVIRGRTATVSRTVLIDPNSSLKEVAVDQSDDTVYAVVPPNGLWSFRGRSMDDSGSSAVGGVPFGVAVDQTDDTVYVTSQGNDDVAVVDGRTAGVVGAVSLGFGASPLGVGVDDVDDTVYVANYGLGTVSVISGRSLAVQATIPVGGTPWAVAVDQARDTAFISDAQFTGRIFVVNGRSATLDDTLTVGASPMGLGLDSAGNLYVASSGATTVSVVSRVTPTLVTQTGEAGATATISVDAPGVAYDLDSFAVTGVTFGGVPATGQAAGAGDTWTVTVPSGSGTVPVEVQFNGGLTAYSGTFTYPSPPPPPVYPPSAPRDVTAVAGDGSAVVTWAAPVDAGSFPVTNYETVSSPAGKSCLIAAPALTCSIDGLTNGTSYTFTVRALNGAGWGASGGPSNAVTPSQPSILITGSRGVGKESGLIRVVGSASGLDGQQVQARVRLAGQAGYRSGTIVSVGSDGSFSWQRKTDRRAFVYFRAPEVRSPRVVIPSR
jgi:YVTN family beta-propeller protein